MVRETQNLSLLSTNMFLLGIFIFFQYVILFATIYFSWVVFNAN